MNDKIWVVIYYNKDCSPLYEGGSPVRILFDNEESAYQCYEYFLGKYNYVDVDECKVYSEWQP